MLLLQLAVQGFQSFLPHPHLETSPASSSSDLAVALAVDALQHRVAAVAVEAAAAAGVERAAVLVPSLALLHFRKRCLSQKKVLFQDISCLVLVAAVVIRAVRVGVTPLSRAHSIVAPYCWRDIEVSLYHPFC